MTGQELKELRTKAGVTQKTLAALVGFRGEANSIYMVESGRRRLSRPAEIAIKTVLARVRAGETIEDICND